MLVTDACNSHCIHCNVWQKKPTENPLSPEEYGKLFSDPFLSDVNEIIISGGEPMMRKDIKQIILALHNSLPNASITLSTNGLMPYTTARIVREVLQEGVEKLSVGTSLDYVGPDHDTIRGTPNAYHKVMLLINHLKKIREDFPSLGIGFGVVLQEKNQDNIGELIKFAEENDLFYLIQWMSDAAYYDNPRAKRCNPEKEYDVVGKLPDRFNMIRELWIKKIKGGNISFNCYALRDFFVVKCNGDVVPCLHLWNYTAGNIRDKPIEEILKFPLGTIKNCKGCLNSWGVGWSAEADGWPYLCYYLKYPVKLWKKIA